MAIYLRLQMDILHNSYLNNLALRSTECKKTNETAISSEHDIVIDAFGPGETSTTIAFFYKHREEKDLPPAFYTIYNF